MLTELPVVRNITITPCRWLRGAYTSHHIIKPTDQRPMGEEW